MKPMRYIHPVVLTAKSHTPLVIPLGAVDAVQWQTYVSRAARRTRMNLTIKGYACVDERQISCQQEKHLGYVETGGPDA